MLDKNRASQIPLERGGIDRPDREIVPAKGAEVLRLLFELGLSQNQIARSCSISQATVSTYLKRAQLAGVGWRLPEGRDEQRLEGALFGRPLSNFTKPVGPAGF